MGTSVRALDRIALQLLTVVVGDLVYVYNAQVVPFAIPAATLAADSHQLLALDDEEFYEKQAPLPLEEVRQLARFLKTWLCR